MITGRRCLLQTFKQVHHLCLLFHIFNFLNDVHIRSTGSTNIDQDRVDEGLLSEVLNFTGHGSGEEKGLALILDRVSERIHARGSGNRESPGER